MGLFGRKAEKKIKQRESLKNLSRSELMDMAKSYSWVHAIDLGDGYTTPGLWGKGNPEITSAFNQIDFRGKRVLDIGCWDGNWSFEAEERGASYVVSTDLITQRDFIEDRTFEVAAALRNSKARYIPDLSVYNVESLGEKFDVVLYMGIYYHLKDPVKSLTVLRRVMADNARILVEGAIVPQPGCYATFYYKDKFCGDNTNWWVPTTECLRQWVQCSFLDIEWEGKQWGHEDNQRGTIVAKAVSRPDPLYARVPEELEEFNR